MTTVRSFYNGRTSRYEVWLDWFPETRYWRVRELVNGRERSFHTKKEHSARQRYEMAVSIRVLVGEGVF